MLQQLLKIKNEHPLKNYTSTKDWSTDYFHLTKDKSPIEKAIIGGFTCQQFSFAFMAGYQAALEQMFPNIAPNQVKALCISEAKGGHPKYIETTLINHHIKGFKTYITAGSAAEHLLVLCKTNEVVNGRPLLKMVHLPQTSDNIKITDFELPFMLEVKHGKLDLNNTKITADQILEGDGFSRYTKPFRTLEDIGVGAAHQAMLLRQAIDYEWDESVREQLLLNIFTLKSLPPLELETHLLLAAYEQNFEDLLPAIESNMTKHSPNQFKEDWERNKKVLFLAKKVKAARLAKARKILL